MAVLSYLKKMKAMFTDDNGDDIPVAIWSKSEMIERENNKTVEDSLSELENPDYTLSPTLSELQNKESYKTAFGKIAKAVSDFITHKSNIASSDTAGHVKSGEAITVDDEGNVSINDNSHKHTVSNISDLNVTADELNHLNGISENVQSQLNNKLNTSLKGQINGLAELDENGKVPESQLPGYVDDVIEYPSLSDFPETAESGKIYVAVDTNLQYRWSGTQYTSMNSEIALGETASTAYRGDRGKIAYNHSQDDSIHITSDEKNNWNEAKTKADTAIQKIKIGNVITADSNSNASVTAVNDEETSTTTLSLTIPKGSDGEKGKDGKSAYDVWLEFEGNENKTEEDFINSLKGADGQDAYGLWKSQEGNEDKTEQDFLNSMKGTSAILDEDGTLHIKDNETDLYSVDLTPLLDIISDGNTMKF